VEGELERGTHNSYCKFNKTHGNVSDVFRCFQASDEGEKRLWCLYYDLVSL